MLVIFWAFLVVGSVLNGQCYASCSSKAPGPLDLSTAKASIRNIINKNPQFGPLFLRAAFHDCFSASKSLKRSGCNGSLRSRRELGDRRNGGIQPLIEAIEPIKNKTCVSVADLLVYGSVLTVYKAGGPFVSPGLGREDVPEEFSDDSNRLPPGGLGTKETAKRIKAAYKKQGFGKRDIVASIVGGHAIGGRTTVAFNKNTGTFEQVRVNFTPHPLKFNAAYARHLIDLIKVRQPNGSMPSGFHVLPSDTSLLSLPNLQRWLLFYANKTPLCSRQKCRKSKFSTLGDLRLYRDFGQFLRKLFAMSDESVLA